jgi:3-dehydroquinate dehydratase
MIGREATELGLKAVVRQSDSEGFRRHSHLSAIATGVIVGLGVQGYLLALRYLASLD